jgi:hypothetical protein
MESLALIQKLDVSTSSSVMLMASLGCLLPLGHRIIVDVLRAHSQLRQKGGRRSSIKDILFYLLSSGKQRHSLDHLTRFYWGEVRQLVTLSFKRGWNRGEEDLSLPSVLCWVWPLGSSCAM